MMTWSWRLETLDSPPSWTLAAKEKSDWFLFSSPNPPFKSAKLTNPLARFQNLVRDPQLHSTRSPQQEGPQLRSRHLVHGLYIVRSDLEIFTRKFENMKNDDSCRYTLLVGRPPFETQSLKDTYSKIKRNEYHIPSRIGPLARALITRMLQGDPCSR